LAVKRVGNPNLSRQESQDVQDEERLGVKLEGVLTVLSSIFGSCLLPLFIQRSFPFIRFWINIHDFFYFY